ncbi:MULTISPECIES: 3-dehydroquinate synthase [Butyricimonas]|uniref:3-dehydroquinate synthase n=1 Tax=Butyricimonas TaxID=574697 RepID=UPI0007FB2923|nr:MULTISPECIES: 3-dehydroquinate synthase [Butyricimonas]
MEHIVFTTDSSMVLADLLRGVRHEQLFIVADKHTVGFCDKLLEKVDWIPLNVAVVDCGEENKSLDSVARIWSVLSRRGARRSSILLCVGGGMVTDMGGFAASTFKRGMRCIYVPTTLLAQVDASLGGKTGINFNGLKNEVGTFKEPERVIIDVMFLKTLPVRERMAGFAEMLKHGLLSDVEYLDRLLTCDTNEPDREEFLDLLKRSISVKSEIVTLDPLEKGTRKALNFGHTVGHAIESCSVTRRENLSHGESVALGMIAELYLSVREKGFPEEIYRRVRDFIKRYYPTYPVMEHADMLCELMSHDKKNDREGLNFTLLENVGQFSVDNYCSRELVMEALRQI